MPRRQKPGGYANRTDLQSTPRGRSYGARSQTLAAAATPESRAGLAGTTAGGPVPTAPTDPFAAALSTLQATPTPPLAGPSTRPGEPVTAGLPVGPGVGPEQIPGLVRQGPNPDVSLWRNHMPMLELLASRPDSSSEMRQFYRRLRAQMPADPFNQPTPG